MTAPERTPPESSHVPSQELRSPPPLLQRTDDRPRYLLAGLLFLASFFTTTTLGAYWTLATRTDVTTDLVPLLGAGIVRRVWSDPTLLSTGLSFALPLLFILLCHELGHYLACRRYRLSATLPYFLPAPLFLGTLGAFIRIRSPIRGKRELFDVGVAGPIAGFVALLPFLLLGVALSPPATVHLVPPDQPTELLLLVPGRSLAMALATWLFHGPLPPGTVLDLHPFALAAWVGLLATALNLLPLGQLDGGHILYAAVGPLQQRLALPLWIALGLAGFFWQGWWFWCLVVLILGLRHPPVWDEREPLDPKRRALAAVALLLLVVSFMPVPLDVVPVLS